MPAEVRKIGIVKVSPTSCQTLCLSILTCKKTEAYEKKYYLNTRAENWSDRVYNFEAIQWINAS